MHSMSRELLPENKYMLDLKEASAFYGIGIKRCRRIAEAGNHIFSIYCGNRWMIHRTKFEEYIERYYFNEEFNGEDEIPIKVF